MVAEERQLVYGSCATVQRKAEYEARPLLPLCTAARPPELGRQASPHTAVLHHYCSITAALQNTN